MTPTRQQNPLCDELLERRVLGACILRPSLLLELPLAEQDFGSAKHRQIWNALLYLHAEGDGVDTVRLYERLSTAGKVESVGGLDYLVGLTDVFPEAAPPTKRLRELTRLRTLRDAANQVLRAVDTGDYDASLAAAADLQLWSTEAQDANLMSAYDCVSRTHGSLTNESKRVIRVRTGLPRMRNAIGDLALGSLTMLGADTNVGKSSIALELLLGTATDHYGAPAGYISREDPEALVGARLLAMMSGVSAKRIERNTLNVQGEDMTLLAAAVASYRALGDRLLLDLRAGGTELDVCAAMTRMAQRGVRLVVVDYAQAIELSGKAQDRRNEVSKVASRIKAHGVRVGQAVVLLSQLSIPQGAKPTDEPQMHWLKESRDLANMADHIMLAWREKQTDMAELRIKYAKGKSGGLNQIWRMQRNELTGRLVELLDRAGDSDDRA